MAALCKVSVWHDGARDEPCSPGLRGLARPSPRPVRSFRRADCVDYHWLPVAYHVFASIPYTQHNSA